MCADIGRTMQGQIDTTFGTYQRDLFESGVVADIGVNAFAVWCAIKLHSNFNTGVSFPSIRRLMAYTGLASATVQKAVTCLEEANLLRSNRKGRRRYYVARECLNVKLGERTICTIVIDYLPNRLRERLGRIKAALQTGESDPDAFVNTEIIPGKGFIWDSDAALLRAEVMLTDISKPPVPISEIHLSSLAMRVKEMGERAKSREKNLNAKKNSTVSFCDSC